MLLPAFIKALWVCGRGSEEIRVIADLHIHSRFSRATSEQMTIKGIARYAKIKGLHLVGTGDFTHPQWLREIRKTLTADGESGFFCVADIPDFPVRFMLTSEVCTIFSFEKYSKKIHHVIFTPSIEDAVKINEKLGKHGNLNSDGRPILNMSAPELVEEVMQSSSKNMVFPAHAWTPWFGVFGVSSGFDSVEECYQDMTKHIFAIETGLSSDPPMNWRLSGLDRFTLLSNSDCHSFWPWRLGREANVFELEKITYQEVTSSIQSKDTKRLKFTIETDPAYGKYHWTGHRNCNVSLSPEKAMKFGNICPVCKKKLTLGVEQRVEGMADRPSGYEATGSPGYIRLLPLSEIIAALLGVDSPSARVVWKIYNQLIERFGDEYSVLIDASREALSGVVDEHIADYIIKVRVGDISVTPGYDGVYGKLNLTGKTSIPSSDSVPSTSRLGPFSDRVQQRNLADFW
jgi:uncharacterized protein (TIGR00375 family)